MPSMPRARCRTAATTRTRHDSTHAWRWPRRRPRVSARSTRPHSASRAAAACATTRGAKDNRKVRWWRDGGRTDVTRLNTPTNPRPSEHDRRIRWRSAIGCRGSWSGTPRRVGDGLTRGRGPRGTRGGPYPMARGRPWDSHATARSARRAGPPPGGSPCPRATIVSMSGTLTAPSASQGGDVDSDLAAIDISGTVQLRSWEDDVLPPVENLGRGCGRCPSRCPRARCATCSCTPWSSTTACR